MEMTDYSIEYLKSGLSVNTHVGCGLGCTYCILTTSIDEFPHQPVCINSATTIYERITSNNSLFVNGLTPIYINNRTDPFLPSVIDNTYDVLDLFSAHKISSPIILISKLAPDYRFTNYCQKLNILFFYTYSGLSGLDYNSNKDINEKNLTQILETVPFENRYHYLRPLIPGYNDSLSKIDSVLELVANKFRSTVAGGVRVNNENAITFGISEYDKHHKLLSHITWDQVQELAKRRSYMVLRHTSCAISVHMKKNNKFQYFGTPYHCILENCENYEYCAHKCAINRLLITKTIQQKTSSCFVWNENSEVIFTDSVEQELIAFLKSTYGISAKATKIILSPSEQRITK